MTVIDTIKHKLHPHHDKHAAAAPDAADAEPAASNAPTVKFSDTPVFDANKITVIFVLGGPGAGTSLFAVCCETKKVELRMRVYRQGYTM